MQKSENNDKLERALGHKPPFNPPERPKAETPKRTPKQAPLKKIRVKHEKIITSFRIGAELHEQLISYCVRQGLTVCQVLEGIITAFVKGTAFIISQEHQKNRKTLCLQVPWICATLNVQVVREQLRPRRNQHDERGYNEKQVNPLLNFDVPCGETCSELMEDY